MKGWKEPVRGEAEWQGSLPGLRKQPLANTETESNKKRGFSSPFLLIIPFFTRNACRISLRSTYTDKSLSFHLKEQRYEAGPVQ